MGPIVLISKSDLSCVSVAEAMVAPPVLEPDVDGGQQKKNDERLTSTGNDDINLANLFLEKLSCSSIIVLRS